MFKRAVYPIPKKVEDLIKKRKEAGFFIFDFEDELALASWYSITKKDNKKAENIVNKVYAVLKNESKLQRAPKFTNPEKFAKFLLELQNPETGGWVRRPTHDHIEIERADFILAQLKRYNLAPKYPLKFLDKYNTKEKLRGYLKGLLYDFSCDNRKELNVGVTKLIKLEKTTRKFYRFEEKWLDVFFDFFKEWQNPKTGCWGPWYKISNKIVKLDDLSITFHILKRYYNEDGTLKNPNFVPQHQKEIVKTIWKIKNREYSYGWLQHGKWSTHHNYDVATIFNILFGFMTKSDQEKVRKLYCEFLDWCLKDCLTKNGGFVGMTPERKKPFIKDTYFGVELLYYIGYFNKEIRERIFSKKQKWKTNSYRLYKHKIPEDEFDTQNMVKIFYTKKSEALDPLDVRHKIFQFVQKTKEFDPDHTLLLYDKLKFREFPPQKIKVQKFRKSKAGQILVPVNKFGQILA